MVVGESERLVVDVCVWKCGAEPEFDARFAFAVRSRREAVVAVGRVGVRTSHGLLDAHCAGFKLVELLLVVSSAPNSWGGVVLP